jgi:hypothetical protein
MLLDLLNDILLGGAGEAGDDEIALLLPLVGLAGPRAVIVLRHIAVVRGTNPPGYGCF